MGNNKKANKRKELEASGAKLPKNWVKRSMKKEIAACLPRDEMILISGSRQTGKSVLVYQLIYEDVYINNR